MHDHPFERLTQDAGFTSQLAQQEAERAHRPYVGTEHIQRPIGFGPGQIG